MSSKLDLRRLRYFRAICDEGSISAAARALNVAQPALSHHVRQLELLFGTTLLRRRSDGIEPTPAGRALYRGAIEAIDRIDRTEAEVLALAKRADPLPKVRLAVISSIAAELTPVLLAGAALDLPDMVFHISEAGTRDGRELIDAGKADLAILLTPAGEAAPIAWELLHLVGAPDMGEVSWVPLADALRRPLIMPARPNPLRELLEEAAAGIDIPLNLILEIDGVRPRLTAVSAGLGNTILGAHSTVSVERAAVSVLPIGDPALRRPLFLAARRGLEPRLVHRVRTLLSRAMSELAGLEITGQTTNSQEE